MTTMLSHALAYASRGWPVFPCRPRGKEPLTPRGFKDATTDPATIRRWWARWPDANIGVPTGQGTFIVLDVDPRNGGDQSLFALVSQYGDLPEGPTARTGGGGTHSFFQPPPFPLRCRTLAPGVDLKADGGYVIMPPSIHPSGARYEWQPGAHPEEIPLPPLPEWLCRLAQDTPQAPSNEIPEVIPEGCRNVTLASLAGTLRARGLNEEEILHVLCKVNQTRCRPPLPDREVQAIARSYARYTPGQLVKAPNNQDPQTLVKDYGHAYQLWPQFHNRFRWADHMNAWMEWTGRVWRPCGEARVAKIASDILRDTYATQLAGAKGREDIVRLTAALREACTYSRITAALAFLKGWDDIYTQAHEWDTDSYLLAVNNGTLDLRTGKLRPHKPEDMITRLVPVDYDPDAKAPLWERFLYRIMDGNEKLIAFLQRAVGYSLTGDTTERVLFLLYGTGANGKTTFLETIYTMLGDYALRTPVETLMLKPANTIPNDIARLKGARLVIASEAEAGHVLAEALVKSLTGGDTVTARFLRAEFFEFRPQCKIWLATNHKPIIRGGEKAIWDRVRLVPFTVTIPENEQDKRLREKLQKELPGILAWAVEGCLEWQRHGLGVPEEVRVATESYREEMDVLGAFIADCCVLDPNGRETAAELYRAYTRWCAEVGEKPVSKRAFGIALGERGFTCRRGAHGVRCWVGIRLIRPLAEDSAPF